MTLDRKLEKESLQIYIRWMNPVRDMSRVLYIDNDAFDISKESTPNNKMVAEYNYMDEHLRVFEEIAGFMIYKIKKSSIHLINLAVDPEFQRRTVGTQMMKALRGKLSANRRNRIYLGVRESNLSAQLFFRQCGFRAANVIPDYFDSPSEAAYLMQYRHGWPVPAVLGPSCNISSQAP